MGYYKIIVMISYLEGKLISKNDKYATVLVGGIGYKIFMSAEALKKIQQSNEDVKIFTYLNVREDALDLYGFLTEQEKELFEMLIMVSGVGPKSALAILALGDPAALAGAISREDIKFLTEVAGIGTKTAKKISVELKDKVAGLSFELGEDAYASSDAEAIEVLTTLGWSNKEAREALQHVPREITSAEQRVKEAMKLLGR